MHGMPPTKRFIFVNLEGTGRSGGDQVNLPHDSPLSGGHTSDRAEGSTKDDNAKLDAELDEDIAYIDTEEVLNEGRESTVDTARPYDGTARQ
nr:hypothetical protein [Tanacetum cinerariifolium]